MGEWNRYGRDDDQRRYGFYDRDRRNFEGEPRYGQNRGWNEQERRSFAERDYGDRRDWRDAPASQRAYGDYRSSGFDPQRSRDWESERRDHARPWERSGDRQDDDLRTGRGQSYDPGQYARERYGAQAYRGETQDYRRRRGLLGGDPRLERISDGDEDQPLHFRAHGAHRGHGPKNYVRSDERIREDVNDRLCDDSWLDASEIEVQVSKCEVTLTGSVNDRDDRRRAEDICEQVSGVKHVQNNLRVQPAGSGQIAQTQGGRPAAGNA